MGGKEETKELEEEVTPKVPARRGRKPGSVNKVIGKRRVGKKRGRRSNLILQKLHAKRLARKLKKEDEKEEIGDSELLIKKTTTTSKF